MASPTNKPQMLTLQQMHEIIDRKESVMLPDGRICTSKHELPSEGALALAVGDPDRQAAAVDDLKQQIANLEASLASLQARPAPMGPTAPATPSNPVEHAPPHPGPADAETPSSQDAEAEALAEKARQRQALLSGETLEPPASAEAKPQPAPAQPSLLPNPPAGPAKPADTTKKK